MNLIRQKYLIGVLTTNLMPLKKAKAGYNEAYKRIALKYGF
nr:hypothetical protein [Mucilaginibacter sp. SP1R1]